MKKKSLLLSLILGIGCLISGLGVVFAQPNRIEVSAATLQTESKYFYRGDGTTSSPIEENEKLDGSPIPGCTIGYRNDIPIGVTNVTLTAAANKGYVLKGWIINDGVNAKYYAISSTVNTYILADGTTKTELDADDKALYKLEKFYTGLENKKASFVVVRASSNLVVEPVFDYQYYKVKVIYDSNQDICEGQAKYGDELNWEDVALTNYVIASGFTGVTSLTSSDYSFTTDGNGLTSSFSLKYSHSEFKDVAIKLIYKQLYKLEFKFNFLESDGVTKTTLTLSDAKYVDILSCLLSDKSKVYKKLDDTTFFVESSGDKLSYFEINDFKKDNYYGYYKFVNFKFGNKKEDTSNLIQYKNLLDSSSSKNSPIPVNLLFEDFKYEIKFKTAVRRDGVVTEKNNLNLPSYAFSSFVRGEGVDIADITEGVNVGYKHAGWAVKKSGRFYEYAEESFNIDEINPVSLDLYEVFEEIEYQYVISGFTEQFKLTNGAVDVYPTYNLIVNGSSYSTDANEIEINKIFRVGDVNNSLVVSRPALNIGFKFLGYGFEKQAPGKVVKYDFSDPNKNNQIINLTDEGVMDNASAENKIYIYAYFEYETYTVKYFVNDQSFVSDISVEIPATAETTASAETVVVDGENKLGYVISKLKLYDSIVLKSEGSEYPDGAEGEKYQCYLFNIDGVSKSPNNGACEHIVNGNSTIQVVYGIPQTTLLIEVTGFYDIEAPSYRLIYVAADNSESFITEKVDSAYLVKSGTVRVELGWNENTYFGYEWDKDNTVLTGNAVVNYEQSYENSNHIFEFDIEGSNDSYSFVIAFKPVEFEYEFVSKYSDDELDNVITGKFSLISPIYFLKTEAGVAKNGYYVNNVKLNGENINIMNQNNDSATVTVEYDLDGDTFVDSIKLFDYYFITFNEIREILKSNYMEGEAFVFAFEYVIYNFDIEVQVLQYKGGESVDLVCKLPQMYMVVDGNVMEYVSLGYGKGYGFKAVPYGYTGEIVVGEIEAGFKLTRFTDLNGHVFGGNYVFAVENKLTERTTLFLVIDFENYTLKFNSTSNKIQVPQDSSEKENVYMYDSISINNALGEDPINLYVDPENGYYCSKLFYVYIYNSESWSDVCLDLYVKRESEFVKNTNEEYDNEETYYIAMDIQSGNIKIKTFNVNDFVVDSGNVINFFVEYEQIKLKIVNNSIFDDVNVEVKNNIKQIFGLETDEAFNDFINKNVAKYAMYVNKGEANEVLISDENPYVTVEDVVTIEIKINKCADGRGFEFDFSKGLVVDGGIYSTEASPFSICSFKLENDTFLLSFPVGKYELLSNVINSEDKTITLTHKFKVGMDKLQSFSTFTNLKDMEEFNSNTILKIGYGKDFASYVSNRDGDKILYVNNNFLLSVRTSLMLGKGWNGAGEKVSNYNEYFNISKANIKVLDTTKEEGKQEIELTTFELNGVEYFGNFEYNIVVEIGREDKYDVLYVYSYLLNTSIQVVYDVQPVLYFEGNIFKPDVNNSYTFGLINQKYYTYDKGNVDQLSIGDDRLKYDIAGFKVKDYYEIKYYDADNLEYSSKNIDMFPAGTYSVVLKKKTGLVGGNPYPEISAKLSLVINKLSLNVGAKDGYGTLSKDYDTQAIFKDFEIKGSGSGVVLEVKDPYGKTINEFYGKDGNLQNATLNIEQALSVSNGGVYITKTIDEFYGLTEQEFAKLTEEEILELEEKYDWANKALRQAKWKDVDKNGLNLYIEKITLTFVGSENYTLAQDYILIEKCFEINPIQLSISNYWVNDKVSDEKEETTIGYNGSITLNGVLKTEGVSDKVFIASEEVKAYFKTAEVGADKTIYVDADSALYGDHRDNYYIGSEHLSKFAYRTFEYKNKGTIYRSELPSEDGSIILKNIRGLTDPTLVGMIPIGAKLYVTKIEKDTEKYVELYPNISGYVSRNNSFQVGYEIVLKDSSGNAVPINSNLHLVVIEAGGMEEVLALSDGGTYIVSHEKHGNGILVDLSQLDINSLSHIVLIESSKMLKTWQIILIIVGAVVLIGGGITAAIIVRKKKTGSYGRFDKI